MVGSDLGQANQLGDGAALPIFPSEVNLVGFWVTSGSVSLSLRDSTGLDLSGHAASTVSAGQFVGISRPNADVKIAALIGNQTDHFTIDDFTFGSASTPPPISGVPEPGSALTLVLAAGFCWFANRRFKS